MSKHLTPALHPGQATVFWAALRLPILQQIPIELMSVRNTDSREPPGIAEMRIGATTAACDRWFLKGGPGDDAIQAHGGYNVIDGSTGSNFLTGGSGTDTFFVDDRGPPADIWSTVNGFHQGDDATVFGMIPAPDGSNFQWMDNQGAVGFTGLTLHVFTPNAPTASLTLPGYSRSDLDSGRLSVGFGSEPDGTPFMHVIAIG